MRRTDQPTITTRTGAVHLLVRGLALSLAVLLLAACGGGGDGTTTDPADADLALVATDFAFDPAEASVAAGEVTVLVENQGGVPHNFLVEGREDEFELETEVDGQDSGTIDLPAGTYTFYCNVPGHRESGMEGTLTVE